MYPFIIYWGCEVYAKLKKEKCTHHTSVYTYNYKTQFYTINYSHYPFIISAWAFGEPSEASRWDRENIYFVCRHEENANTPKCCLLNNI